MPDAASAYVPGVCNINRAEIAYRRKAGHIGLAMFVGLLVLFISVHAPIWTRLFLALPAVLAVSGYLQAKNRFCVAYGADGRQNAEGNDLTTAQVITDRSAKVKDKARARIINIQSVCYGLAAALLSLYL